MTRATPIPTSIVSAIKWRLAQDGTSAAAVQRIAAEYGLSTKRVRRIANGYIYGHVRAIAPEGAETG